VIFATALAATALLGVFAGPFISWAASPRSEPQLRWKRPRVAHAWAALCLAISGYSTWPQHKRGSSASATPVPGETTTVDAMGSAE
jgi:hypothetical protein